MLSEQEDRVVRVQEQRTLLTLSVIGAGCGTELRGFPGFFCAFENMITAVKIRENDEIMMRIARTRM
jgi:hypothetical protein